MSQIKVERNFQPYVFRPIPTWEKPKRERHGYKNELILSGDKVAMLEKNRQLYFENSAIPAFSGVEEAFAGEAEKAGFHSEKSMQDYMKDI